MSRAKPRFSRNNLALPAPVANIFQLIVQGQIEGQMTYSTFYYWDNGAALASTSESNLITGFTTNFWPTYKACLSSDWTGVQILCRCLTTPTRATVINPGISGSAGTGPSGHEPTMVAAVIDRYTGYRGQCGRGRLELPAVPTSWVTASTLTTLTAYNSFVAAAPNGFTQSTISYTPYLWSKGSKFQRQLGAAQAVAFQLRPLLGTIRRRKIGRGK